MNEKIKSFTDLKTWQEGHNLVILIYKITKKFPKEERYSMVDQMRRAASSVTANIAEGFGRQTYREKLQFYFLAQGSLTELKKFYLNSKRCWVLGTRFFCRVSGTIKSHTSAFTRFYQKN